MVKEIRIALDEQEHKQLIKKKGAKTWREFLLEDK